MMNKQLKLNIITCLMILAALTTTSCASNVKPLDTKEDFLGFITEISPSGTNNRIGQILVESDADKLVTRYMVTIRTDTPIFRQEGENLRQVNFQAFAQKQWVKIWFDGPIAESFPMQAQAKQVVITELP